MTQSRIASLMASLSVRLPLVTQDDVRAEQAHAEDVEALTAHVLFAHVDRAIEAEQRANSGGRHAVLARAGLRDDALLAHAPGEQRLPEAIVDFVRAGVEQVFALDVDLRAARVSRKPPREIQRRRTSRVGGQQSLSSSWNAGSLRASS